MDRHVIKGRGPNRGKYLCWARMAPDVKPTDDGFVWLAEQRKAVRWDDPKYRGHTWATERARLHNGYFVEMIAPRAVVERVDELRDFIRSHAARDEKLACYWFDGDFHDAGENFCRDCAEKLVDEKYAADPERFKELYGECDDAEERYDAAIDGGSDIDHDSPPRCETCGADLSGNLTEYGSDQEIEALTGDCAPTFDDAYGWSELDEALVNVSDDDPRWRRIARVVEAAKIEEQKAAEAAAALAASPGMSETRSSLLSLLDARKVQKAPEPSFRLWDDLLAWESTRGNLDEEERAKAEKPLTAEAKRFAAALGFRAHWSGGLFDIEAPYGSYYWPFVVQREQYRLWRPRAYQEGEAYAARRRSKHRDGNPYPEGSVESSQWDCGYMNAVEAPRLAAKETA